MSKHILVVDDEARIREVVQYALEKEGYRVTAVADGEAALSATARGDVDLVVLDVMLPDVGGLEICRRIRGGDVAPATIKNGGVASGREGARLPVLFLSARSEEVDRVVGLEIGGDDYLTKPFSPRELVARVRAVLRRSAEPASPVAAREAQSFGPVTIDVERHEVLCDGEAVELTATEFGVLRSLLERPGVVLSRGQLMQRAYRYDNFITERTIDTHVRRIRAKFRARGVEVIATVHGVGYKAAVEKGQGPTSRG